FPVSGEGGSLPGSVLGASPTGGVPASPAPLSLPSGAPSSEGGLLSPPDFSTFFLTAGAFTDGLDPSAGMHQRDRTRRLPVTVAAIPAPPEGDQPSPLRENGNCRQ